MDTSRPTPSADSHRSAEPPSPEALARTVLRCRELAVHIDSVAKQLPARNEAPFLYSQLDEVLKRLQASLRPLQAEAAGAEKPSFLRRLARGKPRGTSSKSEVTYDLEGNAWTIPLTELVAFLSHSGKSGLLWITTSQETFVLEFARGNLVHAVSNAPPAAYRLGELLVREKLLETAELARLIESAKAADDLLGSYLVRTGRLAHAALQRVMTIQVQQLFHRLMDAENALFRFQEGAQLLRRLSLEVNITQLLLESARKKDEERQHAAVAASRETRATKSEALEVLAEPAPALTAAPEPALPAKEPDVAAAATAEAPPVATQQIQPGTAA